MNFGIHNSSWLDSPEPAEAFEAVKAKAQGAESQGFVWFSVMDHMTRFPGWVRPTNRSLKAGLFWRGLRPSPAVFVLPLFARRSVIVILRISPRSRRASI